MLVFLHSVFVTAFVTFASAEVVDSHMIEHEVFLDGIVSTEHLLFEADVSFDLECAATCMRYAECRAFSTSPAKSSSKKMKCLGHRSKVFPPNSRVAAAGSKTYTMNSNPTVSTWLERSCTTDSACPATVANVECFAGHCLCQLGYYYSHGLDACVADCASRDLQSTFLKYPNRYIQRFNIATFRNCWTFEEGSQHCLSNKKCHTFDIKFNIKKCFMQSVTFLNHSISIRKDDAYDHHQRTCV